MNNSHNAIIKALLHKRFLSRELDAILVAQKLQPQNRTCKPGVILSAICRRDIAGVSSMLSPEFKASLFKIGSIHHQAMKG